jgi:hypothetical protein
MPITPSLSECATNGENQPVVADDPVEFERFPREAQRLHEY